MSHVLVIDDDEMMREMLTQMLLRENLEVTAAEDGKKALDLTREQQFDLIITDIIMPEKEGLETIVDVRKHNEDIPIIAISGGGKIGPGTYLPVASSLGASYTFSKPLNKKEFLGAVNRCLNL